MKRLLSLILCCILLSSVSVTAMASDTPTLSSRGAIQVDVDANGSVDAAFYDSDLTKIKNHITTGKTNLKNALNNYKTYAALGASPTFAQLVSRVNQLTTVPANTYYISTATHQRYVKINNKYYKCNASGVKTTETAETTTPSNLVVYTAGNGNNITEGKALYVNKKLVLGNGADNRTFYAQGVADADARLNKNSKSYKDGVKDADARTNTDSYNYKSGYEAGAASAVPSFTSASGTVIAGTKITTPKPPYFIYLYDDFYENYGSAYCVTSERVWALRDCFVNQVHLRNPSNDVTTGGMMPTSMDDFVWADDGVTITNTEYHGYTYTVYY